MACHQGGAVVFNAIRTLHGQFSCGQEGVLGHLERIATETSEDFSVEVAVLIGDGDGVPNITVDVERNGKFPGQRVAGDKRGVHVRQHEFPAVTVDVGDIVFVLPKRFTVMAPNGVTLVVFVLVEPL